MLMKEFVSAFASKDEGSFLFEILRRVSRVDPLRDDWRGEPGGCLERNGRPWCRPPASRCRPEPWGLHPSRLAPSVRGALPLMIREGPRALRPLRGGPEAAKPAIKTSTLQFAATMDTRHASSWKTVDLFLVLVSLFVLLPCLYYPYTGTCRRRSVSL